jgi:hypothetical protein
VSHRVLQKLVVRLLYDPELVARVFSDPERALAGLELTAAERHMAVAPDRRAYGTDVHRRSRTLTELLREYPAATSLVASTTGGIALLDRFFSSPIFHAAIMERHSLARAFGAYLQALASDGGWDPRLLPFARLEQAIARVRRAPPSRSDGPTPPEPPAGLVRPARIELLTLPAGVLAQHGAVMAALTAGGQDPVAVLLADRSDPPLADRSNPPPTDRSDPPPTAPAWAREQDEHLLVEMDSPPTTAGGAGSPSPANIRVGAITPELAALLAAAAPPGVATPELAAIARELGAEPGAEVELLRDLIAQGLLTPAPAPIGTAPAM